MPIGQSDGGNSLVEILSSQVCLGLCQIVQSYDSHLGMPLFKEVVVEMIISTLVIP